MTRGKINCGYCGCEMDDDGVRVKVAVAHYACRDDVAKALGIEPVGDSFVAICPKCHAEVELDGAMMQ